MSKIKVKQADGSIALLPLGGISKSEADKILGDAKEYTDEKIEKLRQEIPNEISVTDNENDAMPEKATVQIVLDDQEEPTADGDFAKMVKACLKKETWTFTLENGTTVSKAVYVDD